MPIQILQVLISPHPSTTHAKCNEILILENLYSFTYTETIIYAQKIINSPYHLLHHLYTKHASRSTMVSPNTSTCLYAVLQSSSVALSFFTSSRAYYNFSQLFTVLQRTATNIYNLPSKTFQN